MVKMKRETQCNKNKLYRTIVRQFPIKNYRRICFWKLVRSKHLNRIILLN